MNCATIFCGHDLISLQVSYFAPKRDDVAYCTSEATAGCAHKIAKETLRHLVGGNFANCKTPCVNQNYELSHFKLNMWPPRAPNSSRLFLYLSSTNVLVEEEYCLFDLNASISSVGGTLGLFFGFSVYHAVLCVVKLYFRPGPRMRVEYG